jgi:hypothetical protein|tara:strand:- start:173 stop:667 length:495 start_codon:yes stop_codon:yes gene_type:complete
MDVEVIDDFLPNNQFKGIERTLMGDLMPWYFNPYVVYEGDGKCQFTHVFYNTAPPWNGKSSPLFDLWMPCIQKLKCHGLNRIKANLTQRTVFHRKSQHHIDIKDMLTAIFYINTCNGYTRFKGGSNVKSVANRMVIFDSNLPHSGVTCTNGQVRVVVNFNFTRA